MVHGLGDVPYHDRLVYLNVFSMERQLLRGDLIEMFKLFNGFTRLNRWDFFEPIPDGMERGRHPWATFKPHMNTTQRRSCFMVRPISALIFSRVTFCMIETSTSSKKDWIKDGI